MLSLELDPTDDPDFTHAVQTAIVGISRLSRPDEVYVTKLDTWFSSRWLAFSHKVIGAFGIALSDLRIPPFVPNRVLHEQYFMRDHAQNTYVPAPAPITLHIRQPSRANAARRVRQLCPHAALFWWSGSTLATGRGALMAYLPAPRGRDIWYAELTKKTAWRAGNMRGITSNDLAGYQAAALAPQSPIISLPVEQPLNAASPAK